MGELGVGAVFVCLARRSGGLREGCIPEAKQ